ncbi:MAG: hypothetical protein HRF42_07135 [Candidatus Brocadia sp.]|jgi:ABC-2 type transport system permease protein
MAGILAIIVTLIILMGNLFIALIATVLYLMAILGIGLFISTVSKTRQEAMTSVFFSTF